MALSPLYACRQYLDKLAHRVWFLGSATDFMSSVPVEPADEALLWAAALRSQFACNEDTAR